MILVRLRWAVPVLLALSAGCGSTATTPSSFDSSTQFFSGAVAPAASSSVFTLTLAAPSTVGVTLASVTSAATGEPDPSMLLLKVGTASGGTCTATSSATVAAGLQAQVTAALAAGTYCVAVSDPGNLAGPANVTIRVITFNGTPPTSTAVLTELFPTTLARQGTTTKTFTSGATGTLLLTLSSAGSDTTLVIEVGLGVWDGAACRLNTTIQTASGVSPQITALADAGTYCVELIDIGNLTAQVATSGTVQHP